MFFSNWSCIYSIRNVRLHLRLWHNPYAPIRRWKNRVYRSRANLKADWRTHARTESQPYTALATSVDPPSFSWRTSSRRLVPSPDCISLYEQALMIPSLEYLFPFLIYYISGSFTFFLFLFLDGYLSLLGDIRSIVSLLYLPT